MNYSELKTELSARGFDYLSTTRLGQFINDAMHELDDLYPWPYREASGAGIAPVIVADLGTIEQVTNETRQEVLQPRTYQNLSLSFGDLSTTGTPAYYYVSWPDGDPVISTFPTNGDTIGVQYWRVGPDLSSNTDTPLAPTRFHSIIVDIASRMAYRDNDEGSTADNLQGEIDRKVARMANTLLGGQQLQGAGDYQRIYYASEDW